MNAMATSEPQIEQDEMSVRRRALADVLPLVVTMAAGAVCYGLFYRRSP